MTHEQIIESSREIALDSIPSGSNQYSDAIFQIFKQNPDKHFSGKEITELFAGQGVEVKGVSGVLSGFVKIGSLTRPKLGWYTLSS